MRTTFCSIAAQRLSNQTRDGQNHGRGHDSRAATSFALQATFVLSGVCEALGRCRFCFSTRNADDAGIQFARERKDKRRPSSCARLRLKLFREL
jgi:hypothetical protein